MTMICMLKPNSAKWSLFHMWTANTRSGCASSQSAQMLHCPQIDTRLPVLHISRQYSSKIWRLIWNLIVRHMAYRPFCSRGGSWNERLQPYSVSMLWHNVCAKKLTDPAYNMAAERCLGSVSVRCNGDENSSIIIALICVCLAVHADI